MGYYTTYSLEWEAQTKNTLEPNCKHEIPPKAKFCPECGQPVGLTNLSEKISLVISQNSEEWYGIDKFGKSTESCKWYDHEEHMRTLSKQFPTYLFKLRGKGEEAGDIWIKYFMNGKMQLAQAKITFDKFDESKLN